MLCMRVLPIRIATAALLIAGVTAALLRAQSRPVTTAAHFDVASVKITNERWNPGIPRVKISPGRIDFHTSTLFGLIYQAYGPYAPWQLVGPKDRPDALYDVSATMPKTTTPAQLQLMMQTLLAERFKLQLHWQSRNIAAYALEISSRGLKIQKSAHPPGPASTVVTNHGNGVWYMYRVEPDLPVDSQTGRIARSSSFTIEELINALRPTSLQFEDRPLVDQTGLVGYYDFDLRVPCDPEGCFTKLWSDDVFFSALETQLGLRVERKTLPTKMLIVDHVNRVPTPN